jgi:hypothetical protein
MTTCGLVASATSPYGHEAADPQKDPESVIDTGSRLPLQAVVVGL